MASLQRYTRAVVQDFALHSLMKRTAPQAGGPSARAARVSAAAGALHLAAGDLDLACEADLAIGYDEAKATTAKTAATTAATTRDGTLLSVGGSANLTIGPDVNICLSADQTRALLAAFGGGGGGAR